MVNLALKYLFAGANILGHKSPSQLYQTGRGNDADGTLVVVPGNAWDITHNHSHYRAQKDKNQRCLSLMYQKDKTIDETVNDLVHEICDYYDGYQINLPIEGIGYSLGGIIGSEVMKQLDQEIRKTQRYKKEGSEDTIVICEYTAMNSGRSISHLVKMIADIPDVGLWLLGMTNINLEDNIRTLRTKGIKTNIISGKGDRVINEQAHPFNSKDPVSIGHIVWSLTVRPLQTMFAAMVVVTGSAGDVCYEFTHNLILAVVASIFAFLASLVLGPLFGLGALIKNFYDLFEDQKTDHDILTFSRKDGQDTHGLTLDDIVNHRENDQVFDLKEVGDIIKQICPDKSPTETIDDEDDSDESDHEDENRCKKSIFNETCCHSAVSTENIRKHSI